jgi:two-component system, OmpR family, alkaline phosphatase synthesis response regulator PhoP
MISLSKKILFVDDEESQIKLMQNIFYRMGYDAEFAKSAKEALEILDNENISIILTDLQIPDMDGIELCRRIREKGSEVVIYAFSGNIVGVDADHLEDIGFDGLLWKPVGLKVLKRAIEGAFEKIERSRGTREWNIN